MKLDRLIRLFVRTSPVLLPVLFGGCMAAGGPSGSLPRQETRISAHKPQPLDEPRPWQSYYHQIQAGIAEGLENPYLALDETKKALEYRPNSIALRLQKARLEEKVGENDAALDTLVRLTKDYPSRLGPWLELARVKRQLALRTQDPVRRTEQLKSIIPIYTDRVLTLDPLKEEAYVALFDLYARTGQVDRGLSVLKDGVEKNPRSTYLPFYLGFEYTRAKLYDEAEAAFRTAVLRNPGFEPAWESLADIAAQQGKWSEAEAGYRRILDRIQPGNAEVEGKLLRVYLAENAIPKAITFLETIIEEHPQNDRFRLILSSLLVEENRFGPAIDQIEKIIRKNPRNLKLLSFLGSVYERSLHFDQAMDTYQLMIRKFPTSYEGYFDLGDLYRKLNNPKMAIRYLAKARRLAREKWQIAFAMALAYEDDKAYPRALRALHSAMVLKPDNALLYFNRGVLYDQWDHKKYLDRVRADMQKAIALDPKFPDALNYLGYTDVVERGDLIRARYLILRALTFDPQNGSYRDSLGWCYFKMGQLFKALREESLALAKMPDDPTVLSHQGRIERALAQFVAARDVDSRRLGILASAGVSGTDPSRILLGRAMEHLRLSALRHPMKTERVRRYVRYFGHKDPGFSKELRKARIQWNQMHPKTGRPTLYRVKDGDTLQIIAAKGRIYGNPRYWKRLLDANQGLVQDPNHLPSGLILKIPPLRRRVEIQHHSSTAGMILPFPDLL